uniref:Uncharacterized protein n=1 Tax=Octopus bimaculoides TaxID=37653 RepID=A0A0L8H223_OCTBM
MRHTLVKLYGRQHEFSGFELQNMLKQPNVPQQKHFFPNVGQNLGKCDDLIINTIINPASLICCLINFT